LPFCVYMNSYKDNKFGLSAKRKQPNTRVQPPFSGENSLQTTDIYPPQSP